MNFQMREKQIRDMRIRAKWSHYDENGQPYSDWYYFSGYRENRMSFGSHRRFNWFQKRPPHHHSVVRFTHGDQLLGSYKFLKADKKYFKNMMRPERDKYSAIKRITTRMIYVETGNPPDYRRPMGLNWVGPNVRYWRRHRWGQEPEWNEEIRNARW